MRWMPRPPLTNRIAVHIPPRVHKPAEGSCCAALELGQYSRRLLAALVALTASADMVALLAVASVLSWLAAAYNDPQAPTPSPHASSDLQFHLGPDFSELEIVESPDVSAHSSPHLSRPVKFVRSDSTRPELTPSRSVALRFRPPSGRNELGIYECQRETRDHRCHPREDFRYWVCSGRFGASRPSPAITLASGRVCLHWPQQRPVGLVVEPFPRCLFGRQALSGVLILWQWHLLG